MRLRLGQAKVELRAEHFQKLARLWHSRRRAAGAAAAETEKDAAEIEGGAFCETDVCGDARFLRAAFACAARVVAAQGGMHRVAGGHHAALHGEVFDVLKYGSLRVEAELFASPLNCRYDVFCSAHADVDAPFGSLGSFFTFAPRDGSFEVNPPFVSALVARVAARLESLLADAEARGAALSFAVITPHWPRRASWGGARRQRVPRPPAARDRRARPRVRGRRAALQKEEAQARELRHVGALPTDVAGEGRVPAHGRNRRGAERRVPTKALIEFRDAVFF